MKQHHVQYRGNVFYIENEDYVEVLVNSRIIVDVTYFYKVNPNYVKSRINELTRSDSSNNIFMFSSDTETDKIKYNELDKKIMNDKNLMICN